MKHFLPLFSALLMFAFVLTGCKKDDEKPSSSVAGKSWDGSGTATIDGVVAPRTSYLLDNTSLFIGTINKNAADKEAIFVEVELPSATSVNGTYAVNATSNNGISYGTFDPADATFTLSDAVASGGSVVVSNYNATAKTLDVKITGKTAGGKDINLTLNGVKEDAQ